MLIDSHAHLTHSSFDDDREGVIKKLRDLDIKIITVGADMEESEKAAGLTEKYPDQIWATVGLHPHEAIKSIDWIKLKNLAVDKKVIAIGECGLNYHGMINDESGIKKKQKELFIKQIELAKELKKPMIIHCRPAEGTMDAPEDVIEILKYKNLNISSGNGVVHFRRERFIPKGGPDGGDGGKGGSVYMVSDANLATLDHFAFRQRFEAKNGRSGGEKRSTGASADDLYLKVPVGTVVKLTPSLREAAATKQSMQMACGDTWP